MDTQIVAIFCLCDDVLKGLHRHEDKQCKMSDAEVMTTPITAAFFFSGNMETARTFLKEQGYIPNMLGKISKDFSNLAYNTYGQLSIGNCP